jgi:hypothetical protein
LGDADMDRLGCGHHGGKRKAEPQRAGREAATGHDHGCTSGEAALGGRLNDHAGQTLFDRAAR